MYLTLKSSIQLRRVYHNTLVLWSMYNDNHIYFDCIKCIDDIVYSSVASTNNNELL